MEGRLVRSEPATRHLSVATYNLYLGADLTPLFSAPSRQALVRRAAEVHAQVVKTDFPSRAEAIAGLLAADPPEVAGLQEAALWRTGAIGGEPTTSYDFLALLLDALARHGLAYEPVAVSANFSGAMPVSGTTKVAFTDRGVIIARTDLPASRLTVSNPESHTYEARLMIRTPIPGRSFTVPRGWSAVDVKRPGQTVRVVNTHLEAFDTPTRNGQARELLATLDRSPHPVVLVGDLNSPPSDAAGVYGMLSRRGYVDAGVAVHGPRGGFTAGQAADLDNFPSLLDHRVDYVLYQPANIEATAANVLGEAPEDRTPAGLWPSDHAGVAARLHIVHP